jgi:predicted aspartyl protease
MRIVGKWQVSDDGVKFPVVEVEVKTADGQSKSDKFLVDSGADRTVFSANLLEKLGLPRLPVPAGLTLEGIGGESGFVLVETIMKIPGEDGETATLRGQFAAFTDPSATEISILGREVLDHFDVILSRRRGEVLLLAENHTYRVVTA